jgi:DNA-binding transcriptional MerR regulator
VVVTDAIAKKEYYSMGEVCSLAGLRPHVLRYWETQFDVLHPVKNRAGNRVFRAGDIEQVLLVKHLLYEQKYTIEGARQKLGDLRAKGQLTEERQQVMKPEMLATMRGELEALRELLIVPPGQK